LAFDDGDPSEIDIKLFKAGIFTHLHTGLTLVVHSGNNIKAVQLQMVLLKEYEVHASAWVWIHANKINDEQPLIDLAGQGAWISLDGVNMSYIQN
jgi:phosphotriesterase-related protein